jgi:hypothetical protein
VFAPWTIWWRQNFFATASPWVDALMTTTFFHAWVMATGVMTTVAGVLDVYALVTRRRGPFLKPGPPSP